jgi:hypothetical protein
MMINSGDIIEAGNLYTLIDDSDVLHDQSFKFKIVGGRKVYGFICAAWRERSDKTVGLAEMFHGKVKCRWVDPLTKIEILSVEGVI